MKTLKDNRIAMLSGPKIATLDVGSLTSTRARLAEAGLVTPEDGDRVRGRRLQAMRERVWQRDMGLCHCPECVRSGRVLQLNRRAWEMDHLTPIWSGGDDHAMSNLAAESLDCHARKTAQEAAIRAKGDMAPHVVWQRHPHLVALGIDDVPISC